MKKLYKYPNNHRLLDRWFDYMHEKINTHNLFVWVCKSNFYTTQVKRNYKIQAFIVHLYKEYENNYIAILAPEEMKAQIENCKDKII